MIKNRTKLSRSRASAARDGFTLVELLTIIAIIGILSGIFLGALQSADRRSQIAATKSTIQKIHNALMGRWDSYRTLRLPIPADARGGGNFANASDETNSKFREDVARRRMFAMRELLRMEMPDRYSDIYFEPSILYNPLTKTPIRPFLTNAYRRKIEIAFNTWRIKNPGAGFEAFMAHISKSNQSAECLYLIMTTGVEDSSLSTEHFTVRDTVDKDYDGMLEFRDAWNRPIEFLRWAPGFESFMQPYYRYDVKDPKAAVFHPKQPRDPDNPNVYLSRWKIQIDKTIDVNFSGSNRIIDKLIIIDQDDPFNPMRVGPVASPPNNGKFVPSSRWRPDPKMEPPEHGFLLIPLVYSCGPDGESGIDNCLNYEIVYSPTDGQGGVRDSDPYNRYKNTQNGVERYRGDSTGNGYEHDNIHNQTDQASGNK